MDGEETSVKGGVADFAEGDQVGGRIAAGVSPELNVVNMEVFAVLDAFLIGSALIAVPVQHVSFRVVVILLGALLIVWALNCRVGDLMDIEGSQLDFPPGDRQDGFNERPFAEVALNFGQNGGREAILSPHGGAIKAALWAVAGFAAAPGSSVGRALSHLFDDVLAKGDFGLIKDFVVGDRGATKGFAAGIDVCDNFLPVSGGTE